MVGLIAEEAKGLFQQKTEEQLRKIEERKERKRREGQNGEKLGSVLPDNPNPWYKTPHLLHLNFLILIISLTSTNTGYDGSLLNGFQSIPDWKTAMHEPTGAVLGGITNGVVFGVLISTTFAPWVADTFGRRNAITLGNAIMIIGTLVQAVTDTKSNGATSKGPYAQFLVARIIIGVGNGLATTPSPSLIAELAYPTHRQLCTAFFNSNWYLGAIVAAWATFGTRNVPNNWSWRIPTILQGLFPLMQISLIYLVPESPRFLISRGRSEEARAILLKYHAGGDEEFGGALVDFEMGEIQMAIEQEKIAAKFSYIALFQTPGNRKRMFLATVIGFAMQMSGNGLVSYYFSKVLDSIGITSTSRQLIFNGGLMIYNWGISMIINSFLFQRTTRRSCFITSTCAMLLTFVIWTILSAINQKRDFEDGSLGKGVLAMIFLYYLAYNWGLNGLPYLYLTEILPFTIRTKGTNFCVFIQQLCQVYNGFVNPIAMDAIEWKYYIVFCCILGCEVIVVFLTFEETSGRTLEEVAEVFGESIEELDLNVLKLKALAEHKESVVHEGRTNSNSSDSAGSEKAAQLA